MSTGSRRVRAGSPLAGLRFAVIGAGRLGSSLALALQAEEAELTAYTCRTPEGRARGREWLGVPAAADLEELVSTRPALYVVAVPDAVLPKLARDLAAVLAASAVIGDIRPGGADAPVILHTSGVSSVDVLAPCAAAGAVTLAFHPLQTFSEPRTGALRLAGAAIAITPVRGSGETVAIELGFTLSRALGSRPFLLADDKRALYHAAACVASNYLVALEDCAQRLFIEAGMPAEQALGLFLPLVRAAVDNLGAQGPVEALTGPLSRGDVGTISDHLQALSEAEPVLETVYRCMGLATLELVKARGRLDHETISALAELLHPQPCATTTTEKRSNLRRTLS